MGAPIFVYDPDGSIELVSDSDPDEPAEEFAVDYGIKHYPDSIYFFAEFALEPAKDEDVGLVPEPNPDKYVWVVPEGIVKPLRVLAAKDGSMSPEEWASQHGSHKYPDSIYFFGPEEL